jgi:hypothetical protein
MSQLQGMISAATGAVNRLIALNYSQSSGERVRLNAGETTTCVKEYASTQGTNDALVRMFVKGAKDFAHYTGPRPTQKHDQGFCLLPVWLAHL